MKCVTARMLFDNYSMTARQYFDAVDGLPTFVGQHELFQESKKHCEQALENCHTARFALEQHWKEHHCRVAVKGVQ
jgi:hypothetical protein